MEVVTVLYAFAQELREGKTRRLELGGKPCKAAANSYTMEVKEGEMFKDIRVKGKFYASGATLKKGVIFEVPKGARFFVRQKVPNCNQFMWLLVEDDEQISVEENLIQMQIVAEDETPMLAFDEDDVWWHIEPNQEQVSGEGTKTQEDKGSFIMRTGSIGSVAAKVSTKSVQDTLQKTSQEVAAGLSGFARWAKKGLAAATDAMNMTETVKLQNRTVAMRKKLADGGFSEVFLVKCTTSGEDFALKRCLAQSREDVASLKQEIALHRKTESNFVMKLIDHAEEESTRIRGAKELMMLFPLYSDGSLFDQMDNALKENRAWPFPENVAVHFSLGILSGLEALHQAGYVHRDIKPHNVLLALNRSVSGGLKLPTDYQAVTPILMDLGSAAPRTIHIQTRNDALMAADEASVKCSAPYRAPELFEIPSVPYTLTEKVDVWSVGTTIYAMTFGRMYSPFEHPTQGLQTLAIRQAKVAFPSSSQYSDSLRKILEKTMSKDPSNRPTVPQLVSALQRLK